MRCSSFVIEVPFVFGSHADSPNARSLSSYGKSIVVTFATARKAHGQAVTLKLTSPSPPPAHLIADLEPFDVQLSCVPFASRPPVGFWDTFNSSLYLLDVIHRYALDGTVLPIVFMDPDCLVLADISGGLPGHGSIAVYEVGGRSAEQADNGLTALAAEELHRTIDPQLPRGVLPTPVGGEFLAVDPAAFLPLSQECRRAWLYSLERFEKGLEPKFNTEEHVLSFAIRYLPTVQAQFVRRVWTSHKFRDVRSSDLDLAVWHLPAEKGRGFDALYQPAKSPESWFWTSSEKEFRRRVGLVVGVPRRTLRRVVRDTIRSAISATVRFAKRRSQRPMTFG